MTDPSALVRQLEPDLAAWPGELFSDQARVLLAGFLLGTPVPQGLPMRLAATDALLRRVFSQPPAPRAFDALGSLPASERDELLALAEAFVPAGQAPALYDQLVVAGMAPTGERLAALLAVHDPARCDDLVTRAAGALPRGSAAWVELIGAIVVAAADAGRATPAAAEQAWNELAAAAPGPHALPAWLAARLRSHARVDPVAALDELDDAVDEVGAAEVASGATSVIARAAARDREAVWRHLSAVRTMSHRACVLAALVAERAIGAREEAALAEMYDELRAPRSEADRHPQEVWVTTVALLELAAASGRVDLGVQAIAAGRPALSTVFVATRGPALDRALRDARWDPAFWDALARATVDAAGVADGVAPWNQLATDALAALWKIQTLPRPELVWHRAWGALP